MRSWETPEGERRSVAEVQADEVVPSLKFATAKIERTNSKAGAGASRSGQFNDEPPTQTGVAEQALQPTSDVNLQFVGVRVGDQVVHNFVGVAQLRIAGG